MMSAQPPTQSQLLAEVESVLWELAPPGWTVAVDREPTVESGWRPDIIVSVVSPDEDRVVFVGAVKRDGDVRQITDALRQLESSAAAIGGMRPMVIAPWLGPRAREVLAGHHVSYADATGNVRLLSERPGLYVTGVGAAKDPWPADKALQSLRGRGAMRALRALLDFAPPYGVRELAARADVSAATLSRVIGLLARDGLVVRDDKGAVTEVDWAAVIRRWAQDYDVVRTNDGMSYLQPRGLAALTNVLGETSLRYAVTGSVAARAFAPVAPARLGTVYVDNVAAAVETLDLRPADAGANVILLQPYDGVVFERLVERDGLQLVNPTQLAVDLLTGPGRAPNEGAELLAWMEGHTSEWRG
jgi:hypothetical protein